MRWRDGVRWRRRTAGPNCTITTGLYLLSVVGLYRRPWFDGASARRTVVLCGLLTCGLLPFAADFSSQFIDWLMPFLALLWGLMGVRSILLGGIGIEFASLVVPADAAWRPLLRRLIIALQVASVVGAIAVLGLGLQHYLSDDVSRVATSPASEIADAVKRLAGPTSPPNSGITISNPAAIPTSSAYG